MENPQKSWGTNPFLELPLHINLKAWKGHRPHALREDFISHSSYIVEMCGELNPEMGGLTPAQAVEELDQLLGRIRARKSFTEVVPQWREKAKRFYLGHRRLAQIMQHVHRWGMPPTSIRALEANAVDYLKCLELGKAEEQLVMLHEVSSEKVGYYI